jgi:putative cardiolipin synthase
MSLMRPALFLTSLLLISACTSVPFDYPKEPSAALPSSTESYYGRTLADWQQDNGTETTGSVMLIRGLDALGSRLVMMDRAESSIDAQYFLLKPDKAGDLFLGKLLRAADRGVRVRLLLDDIFTPRNDRMLAIFDSHPNIEVRLFNPVSRTSPKAWSLLWDFSRVNRRMHNKAFVVDGSLAIMGGRNIAAEYFELKPQQKFDDFEMLMIGEVVSEIATSFDYFWNSRLAVPMEAIRVSDKPERITRWLDYMDEVVSGERASPYAASINSPFLQKVIDREIKPYISTADLYYDYPEKLKVSRRAKEHRHLMSAVLERLRAAQEEIIIITPYLVPRDLGHGLLEEARARGVRVTIITNSLASTNHVAVHSGYGPRRKGMLKAGAEIYEIKVDAPPAFASDDDEEDRVTLHTKAIIIDGQQLFIGSLNFDPRSIEINTEVGLFIHSREAAGDYRDLVLNDLPRYTYRVELDERDRLRWAYRHEGEEAIYHKEPGTSAWKRFKVGFYRLLPIEDQL